MSINLINEANFFVVIIALIIIFFLLGLLLGFIIDTPNKTPKEKKKDAIAGRKEQSAPSDALGQDKQESLDNKEQGEIPRSRNPGNRYYNNYWW
jgi:preprotein translocase subunit SecG